MKKQTKEIHTLCLSRLIFASYIVPRFGSSSFLCSSCARINTHLFHGLLNHVKRCGQGKWGGGGGWPREMGNVHYQEELGDRQLPRPEPVSTSASFSNTCNSEDKQFITHSWCSADVVIQLAASSLWSQQFFLESWTKKDQNQKFPSNWF